jgi:CRISPR/Cas system-associated endoribonuclease Cas2
VTSDCVAVGKGNFPYQRSKVLFGFFAGYCQKLQFSIFMGGGDETEIEAVRPGNRRAAKPQ